MIVLLQKQDDKYLMKSFANPTGIGDNVMVSPITKICNTIVRLNAVDNRAFFLINQSDQNSQMLELTAPTQQESEVWIRRITEAAEKANHLKKVQSKPLPAIPVPPPPPALEETPENLLNSPPEESEKPQTSTDAETSKEPSDEKKEPEEEPEPQDDPNAIQTTQPCQLIQPTEISIAAQDVQEASRIVTPEESLKRHGDVIQKAVVEMEKIICDINRVPREHFSEIADIAAQPEAQSDLADLALAAFAQTKFLVECVKTSLINGTVNTPIPSISGVALCDSCVKKDSFIGDQKEVTENAHIVETLSMDTDVIKDTETDSDNLYCEIEPLKNETIIATKVSHMEINDTYSSSGCGIDPKKSAIIKIDQIANSVTILNALVSQLSVSRGTKKESLPVL